MSIGFTELVDVVAQDFAARGITAQVLFGDWNASAHNSGNRVVIGAAAQFEDADLGPANAPGLQDLGAHTFAARTLFTVAEYCTVWVHREPVGGEADPARLRESFRATMQLVKQTIRAMHRACPGAFGWGQGTFVRPERSEFRFGALATFRAQLLTPVLDDDIPIRMATGYSAEIYAETPNEGSLLVGTIEKDLP